MKFIAAFSYLTVLPMPWRLKARPVPAAHIAFLFPLVGLLIGLALAGLRWIFGLILPPAVGNALIIAALVLITGVRPLSGLAHTSDAIVGVRMAKARLQIIRDGNVGSFAVAAICGMLLLKYIALNNLPSYWVLPALVMAPLTARWAMVYMMYLFPRVEPSSARRARQRGTRGWQFLTATAVTFGGAVILILAGHNFPGAVGGGQIISLMLAAATALALMIIVTAVITALGYWLCRRLPGLTPETDGAVVELTESLTFILISILAFVIL